MKMPWWVHRTIIIGLTGGCILVGAYNILQSTGFIGLFPGNSVQPAMLMAFLVICMVLGFVPQLIVRKLAHARRPMNDRP
ncbi:MAG: hypothetical protein V3S89_06820 [Desulfobacterales bacterium]